MEESIFGALQLLVVGMITVFLILTIVINLGKCLILLVNKFAPAEETVQKKKPTVSASPIDANTQAIIKATVDKLTNGKGSVANITKI